MFMTEWREQSDGSYWESTVKWNAFSQAIAVMRCVKDSNGNYEAVVREATRAAHESGPMLASYPKKCTLDFAKYQCIALVMKMAILEVVFE